VAGKGKEEMGEAAEKKGWEGRERNGRERKRKGETKGEMRMKREVRRRG